MLSIPVMAKLNFQHPLLHYSLTIQSIENSCAAFCLNDEFFSGFFDLFDS